MAQIKCRPGHATSAISVRTTSPPRLRFGLHVSTKRLVSTIAAIIVALITGWQGGQREKEPALPCCAALVALRNKAQQAQ